MSERTTEYYEHSLEDVCIRLMQLLIKKHRDYGTNNLLKFGTFGILVRSSDKIERLVNLQNRKESVEDETILDTWMDVAGYALQAIMMLENTFSNPLINADANEIPEHSTDNSIV